MSAKKKKLTINRCKRVNCKTEIYYFISKKDFNCTFTTNVNRYLQIKSKFINI